MSASDRMRSARTAIGLAVRLAWAVTLLGCDGDEDGGDDGGADGGADDGGADGGADALVGPVVNGCPTYPDPLALPSDPPGGLSYGATAEPFFTGYCTRCHSTTLTGTDRNFAPPGLDWDDEDSVRAHLDAIRSAIGVDNFMPPSDPMPSCDERRDVVRWIDLGAPP